MTEVEVETIPQPTYDLLEQGVSSGFGTVWKGIRRDPDGQERKVLVTLLDTAATKEPAFLDRVKKDLEPLWALRNPNIGLIEAIIEVSHLPAVVSFEVPGPRLSDLLQGGPLSPRAAAELALEIAWALHAAHAASSEETIRPLELTHGAIRPEVLRLTGAGEVVLVEYGLYRASHPGEPTATDIHGLGGVLYACLTGITPNLHEQPDPREALNAALARLPSGLPEDLIVLLRECLEPVATLRPPAREVARRLRLVIPELEGDWLSALADKRIGGQVRERPEPPPPPIGSESEQAKTSESPKKVKKEEGDAILRPLKKAGGEHDTSAADRRQLYVFLAMVALLLTGTGAFAIRRIWLPWFGVYDGPDVATDEAGPDKEAAAGPVSGGGAAKAEKREGEAVPGGGGGPVTLIESERGIEAEEKGDRPERERVETDEAIQTATPPGESPPASPLTLPEGPPPWPRPEGTLGDIDLFVEVALAKETQVRCENGLVSKGPSPERTAMLQITPTTCTIHGRFPPDSEASAQIQVQASQDIVCRLGLPGKLRCAPRPAPLQPPPEAPVAAPGERVDLDLRVPLARSVEVTCAENKRQTALIRERILLTDIAQGDCRVMATLPDGVQEGTFTLDRSKAVVCLRAERAGRLRCSDAIALP